MNSPRPAPFHLTPSARARLAAALLGWFLALLLLPLATHRFGDWLFVLAPLLGAYFVSWIGMLRHELWHGYVEGVDNRFFYWVTCFALCLEPETYRLSHASHHLHANTDRDRQLYPENFLRDPRRARFQFAMELLLGNLAWEIAMTARLHRQGQLTGRTLLAHLPGRLVLPALLVIFIRVAAPEATGTAMIHWVAMFWAGSLTTRHHQWLQHLGIFATGDEEARDLLTRNLRNRTLLERVVNALNHDDSVAHTYHHTEPKLYTRLHPGMPPAPHHVQITLGEYFAILTSFGRRLFAPEPTFPVQHLGSLDGPPESARTATDLPTEATQVN